MIPLPHVPLQFILSMNAGRFPDYPIEYSKCSPKEQINTLPYGPFLVQKIFIYFKNHPFWRTLPRTRKKMLYYS